MKTPRPFIRNELPLPQKSTRQDLTNQILAVTLLSSFLLFLLASALIKIDGWDIWWHLHLGEYIVNTRSIPTIDHFTVLGEGRDYLDSHWLYQILIYGFTVILGNNGVSLYQSLMIGLLFGAPLLLLGKKRLQLQTLTFAVPVVALGVLAASHRFLPRPELFTYLSISLFITVLEHYRRTTSKTIYLLPLLMIVWQNTHALYPIGYFIVGAYVAEAVLAPWLAEGRPGRLEIKPLALSFLLSLLVYFANPHGLDLIRYSYLLSTEVGKNADPFMRIIMELIPTFSAKNMQSFQFPFYLLLLVGVCVVLVRRGKAMRLAHPIILIVFFVLAISANRNTPIFISAALPIIILLLHDDDRWRLPVPLQRGVAIAFTLLMLFQGYRLVSNTHYKAQDMVTRFGLGFSDLYYPQGAVDYLKKTRPAGDIAHFDNFGGYYMYNLASSGYRPLFDGRWEIYDHDTLYDLFLAVENPPAFLQKLSKFNIDLVLVYYLREGNRELMKYLHHAKEWQLVFCDHNAAVYSKQPQTKNASGQRLPVRVSDLLQTVRFDQEAVASGLPQNAVNILWSIGEKYFAATIADKVLKYAPQDRQSLEVLAAYMAEKLQVTPP